MTVWVVGHVVYCYIDEVGFSVDVHLEFIVFSLDGTQKCQTIIERKQQKFLLHIKPTAPQLNAYIKTHKEGEPIRPVINNRQAPLIQNSQIHQQKTIMFNRNTERVQL